MKNVMLVALMLVSGNLVMAAEAPKGGTPGKGIMGMLSKVFGGGAARAEAPTVTAVAASVGAPMSEAAVLAAVTALPKLTLSERVERDARQTHVLAVNTEDAKYMHSRKDDVIAGPDFYNLMKGAVVRAGVAVSADPVVMAGVITRVNAHMISTGAANAHMKVGPELMVGAVHSGILK